MKAVSLYAPLNKAIYRKVKGLIIMEKKSKIFLGLNKLSVKFTEAITSF
jgi:hypothetical protein